LDLDYFSALNNADENKHHSYDKKDVNKPPDAVNADDAKQPKNKEYDRDSIKHAGYFIFYVDPSTSYKEGRGNGRYITGVI
jgi:hypothetical protein